MHLAPDRREVAGRARVHQGSGGRSRTAASGPSMARRISPTVIVVGRSGQARSAPGTPVRVHDARPPQLGEDVLEEVLRDVLGRAISRALSVGAVGRGGQLDDRPHRVVRLGRDPHGARALTSRGGDLHVDSR